MFLRFSFYFLLRLRGKGVWFWHVCVTGGGQEQGG